MPSRRKENRLKSFSDEILVERLRPEPKRNDLKELRAGLDDIRPELNALAKFFKKSRGRFKERGIKAEDWKQIEAFVRKKAPGLRKELSRQKGSPVTKLELETLLEIGLGRSRAALALALDDSPTFDLLVTANLAAEGSYQIIGDRLEWRTPGQEPIVFNTSDKDDKEIAATILGASLALEVFGFAAALVGFSLPNVDIVRIANRFFRTRSRTVRRQVEALIRVLNNAKRTSLEKVEAIIKFLNGLANAGILSDLVAQIYVDLSWWRIGIIVVQISAQIAALLVPGVQAALLVKKGVAIANAIGALGAKGRDLGDLLTQITIKLPLPVVHAWDSKKSSGADSDSGNPSELKWLTVATTPAPSRRDHR